MKRCPKCNLNYDETLSFCLEDGTPLIRASDPDATLVLTTQVPAHESARRSSTRLFYGIILLLVILAVGVTVALFYNRDRLGANVQAQPPRVNANENQNSGQQAPSSPLVANAPRKNAAGTTATPKSYPVCGTVIFCVGD
jgi:uncharacterized protein HemX